MSRKCSKPVSADKLGKSPVLSPHRNRPLNPGGEYICRIQCRKTAYQMSCESILFYKSPKTHTGSTKMVLSDSEIKTAIRTKQLTIQPLGRVNPAGIDLRVDRDVTLKPQQQTLAATIERVELSNKLVGILHIRSSLAREGIVASLALVDPGFRGQLTVSLYNAGARPVKLKHGERFIQLSLLRLNTPSKQTYSGKYQDSRGVVASRRRKKSYPRRMERVIHAALGKAAEA